MSCISLSMKTVVENRINNRSEKETQNESRKLISCAFYRSYFVFYLSLLNYIQIGHFT